MPKKSDPDELVQVFATADSNLLPIVKSVLESVGIPYVVQGDEAMGLFPLGQLGGGWPLRKALGARIHVPRSRADEARELLKGNIESP